MYHQILNIEHKERAFQNAGGDVEYIELVHSGEDYFLRMKSIIENAKEEIHLQTYILKCPFFMFYI